MSDTELSAKLDRWIDDNTVDADFIAHPDFVYDKLLELETEIKKLQAENAELKKQRQWISVNDELPSIIGEEYIVCCGEFRASMTYLINGWHDVNGQYWGYNVTHWMPLPAVLCDPEFWIRANLKL